MNIIDLIPGVAQIKSAISIIMAIIFLGACGYIYWEWSDLQDLKKANAVLIENNKVLQENEDVLKGNLTTCQNSNVTNQSTINDLIIERKSAQDIIDNLSKEKQNNLSSVKQLQDTINSMKNSKSDGPLAPVLKLTIKGIENE